MDSCNSNHHHPWPASSAALLVNEAERSPSYTTIYISSSSPGKIRVPPLMEFFHRSKQGISVSHNLVRYCLLVSGGYVVPSYIRALMTSFNKVLLRVHEIPFASIPISDSDLLPQISQLLNA